jgi:ATP-dependent helicase/nuclease subunit A
MVNRVFSDVATITRLFPGPAAATWNLEWRKHESAQPHRNGQSAVLLAEDEPDRWTRVVEILQEIRPVERGLTCAVLVQTNKVATELADFLRRHGNVPAVAESDLHVCTDNPVGAALVALVQAAAHPGDSLAWEHVQMTPLGAMLTEEGVVTQETATLRLLAQLHADGFERTMEFWLKKVEAHLDPADAFSRTRARQFAAAAARFDRTGSRDVAEFVEFMEHHVVRESESAAVVRVMTIHKSKGLGFDVVLLPDLEGKRIDQRRDGLAVQKAKDRTVEWILDLPPKLFYQADPVLAAHVRVAEADACYEALSLLYVAMTRAKRATYAIVEASADSTSRNYPKFLGETLGNDPCDVRIGALNSSGLWVRGDADWHLALPVPPAHARRVERKLETLAAIPTKWMVGREVRRPSGDRLQRIAAGQLFSLDAGEAAAFGAEVHSLLAEVEWGTAPAMAGAWRARGASDDAVAESIACLQATQLADLWVEPKAGEVWRERAFEIVLDNVWITGVFDRVIVERNARNGVEWVTVIDFKTDRVDDERAVTEAAARHASQLNLYRRVAAALTGVPVDAVTCELVFTRLQRRFRVPAA